MPPIKLTTPAYLVLGMVEQLGSATPYDLKAFAELSVSKFWALPHTQIYAQCDRLVEAGLLSEERETGGRRRRLLSITPEGASALDAWRAEPAPEPVEMRSLATLKLFFGADPATLAAEQLARHEAQLQEYLALEGLDGLEPGQRLALEMGIGHEREFIRYWRELAERPAQPVSPPPPPDVSAGPPDRRPSAPSGASRPAWPVASAGCAPPARPRSRPAWLRPRPSCSSPPPRPTPPR